VVAILLIAAERHTVTPAFLLLPIAALAGLWLVWAYFPRPDPALIEDPRYAVGGLMVLAFLRLMELMDRLAERFETWASSRNHRDGDPNARGPFGQD
jgi:hypothetical protein